MRTSPQIRQGRSGCTPATVSNTAGRVNSASDGMSDDSSVGGAPGSRPAGRAGPAGDVRRRGSALLGADRLGEELAGDEPGPSEQADPRPEGGGEPVGHHDRGQEVPQGKHSEHRGRDDRQVGEVAELRDLRQLQDGQDPERDGQDRQQAPEAGIGVEPGGHVEPRARKVADIAEVATATARCADEVEDEVRQQHEEGTHAAGDEAPGDGDATGGRGRPVAVVGLAVARLLAVLALLTEARLLAVLALLAIARLLAVLALLAIARLLAVLALLATARRPVLAAAAPGRGPAFAAGGLAAVAARLAALAALAPLAAPALTAPLASVAGGGAVALLAGALVGLGSGARRVGGIDAALTGRVRDVLGPSGAVVVKLGEASGGLRIPARTDLGHRSVSSWIRKSAEGDDASWRGTPPWTFASEMVRSPPIVPSPTRVRATLDRSRPRLYPRQPMGARRPRHRSRSTNGLRARCRSGRGSAPSPEVPEPPRGAAPPSRPACGPGRPGRRRRR